VFPLVAAAEGKTGGARALVRTSPSAATPSLFRSIHRPVTRSSRSVSTGVMFSVGAEQVQRRDHGAGVFEAESVAVEHVE